MSKDYQELRYPGGAYKGYAFSSEDVQKLHEEAHDTVSKIDRSRAIVEVQPQYNATLYTLDPVLTEGLSDFEKLILANGRPMPFGGVPRGNNRYEVYED